MQHPISSNRYFLLSYILLALVFVVLDCVIGFNVFKLSFLFLIIRIIIPDILLFFMLLSLWYPVCFFEKKGNVVYNLAQFFLTGIIFIGVWLLFNVLLCNGLSSLFIVKCQVYSGFYLMRLLVGFLCYLLFVMVFFMIHYHQEIEEKSIKELGLLNLLKQSELDMLKSQINPHFLYNSLNSISSLTLRCPEKAQEMIANLSDFLRYSLKKKSNEIVSFQQEYESIVKYLDIEKIRFEDRMEILWLVDKECKQKLLPVLILQPLMENAVKYGVYDSIEAVRIVFKASVQNSDLLIEISNPCDDSLYYKKGEGVGLDNIRKRLLNIYGMNNLIDIKRTKNLFIVSVRFPQIQHDQELKKYFYG